jgi:hypothetical protein
MLPDTNSPQPSDPNLPNSPDAPVPTQQVSPEVQAMMVHPAGQEPTPVAPQSEQPPAQPETMPLPPIGDGPLGDAPTDDPMPEENQPDEPEEPEETATPTQPTAVSVKKPKKDWSWLKNKYLVASNGLLVLIIIASVPKWLTFSTKLSNLADSVGISFDKQVAQVQHVVIGVAVALIIVNLVIVRTRFKWLAVVSLAANGYAAYAIYNQRPAGAPGVAASPVFWAALGLAALHLVVLLLILIRLKATKNPAPVQPVAPQVS